jgi:hypothetical protein
MQPFFHFLAISRGSRNTTESVWGCPWPAVLTSHERQDSDAWGRSQLNARPSTRIVANWAGPPGNNLDRCQYCMRRPSPRSPGDGGVDAGQVWRRPISFFVFFLNPAAIGDACSDWRDALLSIGSAGCRWRWLLSLFSFFSA